MTWAAFYEYFEKQIPRFARDDRECDHLASLGMTGAEWSASLGMGGSKSRTLASLGMTQVDRSPLTGGVGLEEAPS